MEKVILSQTSHLNTIAICHRSAFPESLTSSLGNRFVEAMLSWYLSTDKTFLFHITNSEGKCTGYCGAIISDGTLGTGSASGMAQHTFRAAIIAFLTHPWVIFHPEVRAKWPLLWKNILVRLGLQSRNHFTPEQTQKMALEPHVGLVVIGVHPSWQGKGIGSLLLQEFERRAVHDYGIHRLQLTVRSDNQQAIRAYQKNGWQRGEEKSGSLAMWKEVV